MRGGFLHNQVLAARVEHAFRASGAEVCREYRIVTSALEGYVDLMVTCGGRRIACEIELTAERIYWDVAKAQAMHAVLLLIVVPNEQLARTVRQKLTDRQTTRRPLKLSVFCLTVGAVLEALRNKSLLKSVLNVDTTLIHPTITSATTSSERSRPCKFNGGT
ncbi:MAG: hypothetical protein PCFJNLEI_01615 [Verrucomicrobiae bacterium]|nr:hypothetical protein [Verrucomicrobiae bacterium]